MYIYEFVIQYLNAKQKTFLYWAVLSSEENYQKNEEEENENQTKYLLNPNKVEWRLLMKLSLRPPYTVPDCSLRLDKLSPLGTFYNQAL